MKIDLYCQRQNCSPLNVLFSVPPLGVYNHNTVGENGDFQVTSTPENVSQTVSNAATVSINHQ